jgi:hypothetical protein
LDGEVSKELSNSIGRGQIQKARTKETIKRIAIKKDFGKKLGYLNYFLYI